MQLTAFSFSVLSTILCDVQVPLFNASCRVLGLNLKLITAPLWRLIEQDSHILDMNMHYLELYTFLSEHLKMPVSLCKEAAYWLHIA